MVTWNFILRNIQNVFAAPSEVTEADEFLAEFFANKADVIDPAIIIAQYECFVNVLQEESEANGLGNLWSLSKKRFASNIAKWKKCGTYSSATGAVYEHYNHQFLYAQP